MLQKILKNIGFVLSILLLVLIIVHICLPLFGISYKIVVSGSMEPNIKVGSLVYIKNVNFSSLEVGDVITYSIDNTYITHRIVSIDALTNSVITKGDANISNDLASVSSSQIVGKVTFVIPVIGYIIYYCQQNIFLIFGIILFIILLTIFIKMIKNYKKG